MSKQDPASGLKKFFDSAAEAHFGMSKAAEDELKNKGASGAGVIVALLVIGFLLILFCGATTPRG